MSMEEKGGKPTGTEKPLKGEEPTGGEKLYSWLKDASVNVDKACKDIGDKIMPPVGSTSEANMAKMFAAPAATDASAGEQKAEASTADASATVRSHDAAAKEKTDEQGTVATTNDPSATSAATPSATGSEFVMVEATVVDGTEEEADKNAEKSIAKTEATPSQQPQNDTASEIVNWLTDAARKINKSLQEFSEEFLPDVKNKEKAPGEKVSGSAESGETDKEEGAPQKTNSAPQTRAPTADDALKWLQSTVWKLNKKINPQSSSSDSTNKGSDP